ncbi:hypothetical protein C8J56DRAFT_896295 [Mycena floridula]|nr:hypothetical protein C8J56DRAFT_896295 [Mycena floridula]
MSIPKIIIAGQPFQIIWTRSATDPASFFLELLKDGTVIVQGLPTAVKGTSGVIPIPQSELNQGKHSIPQSSLLKLIRLSSCSSYLFRATELKNPKSQCFQGWQYFGVTVSSPANELGRDGLHYFFHVGEAMSHCWIVTSWDLTRTIQGAGKARRGRHPISSLNEDQYCVVKAMPTLVCNFMDGRGKKDDIISTRKVPSTWAYALSMPAEGLAVIERDEAGCYPKYGIAPGTSLTMRLKAMQCDYHNHGLPQKESDNMSDSEAFSMTIGIDTAHISTNSGSRTTRMFRTISVNPVASPSSSRSIYDEHPAASKLPITIGCVISVVVVCVRILDIFTLLFAS